MLSRIQISACSEDPPTWAPVLRADLKSAHTLSTENTVQSGSERMGLWMRHGESGRKRGFSWQCSVAVIVCGGGKERVESLHVGAECPSQGSAVHRLHKGRSHIAELTSACSGKREKCLLPIEYSMHVSSKQNRGERNMASLLTQNAVGKRQPKWCGCVCCFSALSDSPS